MKIFTISRNASRHILSIYDIEKWINLRLNAAESRAFALTIFQLTRREIQSARVELSKGEISSALPAYLILYRDLSDKVAVTSGPNAERFLLLPSNVVQGVSVCPIVFDLRRIIAHKSPGE